MWKRAARVGVVLSLLLCAGCQSVNIMSDLAETDALDIIVLLRHNGIEATKTGAGSGQDVFWTVTVSGSDASNAFLVMAENDLPRQKPKGFETYFGQSKLIPTETEEKAIFLQAQAGELASTIEAMPSVIDARVHISIPQHDPLRQLMEGEKPPSPTAAIFVKHWMPDQAAPPETRLNASDIKTLVAGSIENLEATRVNVVMKAVIPDVAAPIQNRNDPTVLFLPMAGLTLLLVGVVVLMVLKNRSLSRQLTDSIVKGPQPVDS